MATYFQDELTRKDLEDCIPQMEAIVSEREGKRIIKCWECFYSMFGKCPTYGSRNAACFTMQKSYMEMPKKTLIEVTETEYKQALQNAAKMYNARMTMIKNMFSEEQEETNEELH